jgi:hypothetical protein
MTSFESLERFSLEHSVHKVSEMFLLLHGLCWHNVLSSGTPASSTTKTGRHDIAEILLKVALNTKIQIQILL